MQDLQTFYDWMISSAKKGESTAGITITVGTSVPDDNSVWLDTSNYQQGGGE